MTLVRSAHEEAAGRTGGALSSEDLTLLERFRTERFSVIPVSLAPGLDARAFGKIARGLLQADREVDTTASDRRLLVLKKPMRDLQVKTAIGLQARPFYFQSIVDAQGTEIVERQSYLRLLGISSQTVLDEARRGEEESQAGVILRSVTEFENWLEAVTAQ